MILFRQGLQKKLIDLCTTLVGPGTDPTDYIHTFEKRLRDYDLDLVSAPWPVLVINVRTVEQSGRSEPEIQSETPYRLWQWVVHIYYLDVTDDYDEGEARRDKIVEKVADAIEINPRLDNFEVTDGAGKREYVWDTQITTGIFDSSGQEEYHTFVTELYLTIDTAKT